MDFTIDQIIAIILFIILVYYLFVCNKESFSNLTFQDTQTTNISNSFINFNRPVKFDWNLFMLDMKFKFQSIFPFFNLSESPLIYPHNGIAKAPTATPILLIPGLGDCVLKFDNKMVWPPVDKYYLNYLIKDQALNLSYYTEGNLTPLINTLKALKYDDSTLSIHPYDFRNIGDNDHLTVFLKGITQSIINLYNYSKKPVLLVGHDLGCTLLSVFLQRQQESTLKEYVKEMVCVSSVLGGSIQGAKDFIQGIPSISKIPDDVRQFDGLKLKIPNPIIFENIEILTYDKVVYKGGDLVKLFKKLKIDTDLNNCYKIQEESLKKPVIPVTFINNKFGHKLHQEVYDYWNPKQILTIDMEGAKMFNNYDTVLHILKLLEI